MTWTFNFLAMCTAVTQIFQCIHHSHNSIPSLFSTGDLDPLMLLIYDMAVVLSIWIWTWVSLTWLQNDFSAKKAALSSKMFLWSMVSLVFYLPPICWSPYTAPHLLFEASVCSWMFALRGWIFLQALPFELFVWFQCFKNFLFCWWDNHAAESKLNPRKVSLIVGIIRDFKGCRWNCNFLKNITVSLIFCMNESSIYPRHTWPKEHK